MIALAFIHAPDYFLCHRIVNLFRVVGKSKRRNSRFIVFFLQFLPNKTHFFSIIFIKWKVLLGDGFIICERRRFIWEKFPILINPSPSVLVGHVVHMFFYPRYHILILFFGVLLV